MHGLRDRLEKFFVHQATELARDAAYEEQEKLAEVLTELEERRAELAEAQGRLAHPGDAEADDRLGELARRLSEREAALARARNELEQAHRRAAESVEQAQRRAAESDRRASVLAETLRARETELETAQARVRECEELLSRRPEPEAGPPAGADGLDAKRAELARATAEVRRRQALLARQLVEVEQVALRLEAEKDLHERELERRRLRLDEREAAVAATEARVGRYVSEVQASLRR